MNKRPRLAIFLVSFGLMAVAARCASEDGTPGVVVRGNESGTNGAGTSSGSAGSSNASGANNTGGSSAHSGQSGSNQGGSVDQLDGGVDASDDVVDASIDVVSSDSGTTSLFTRYPASARHSPMTQGVIDHLRGILSQSNGRKEVFAKVGDSITVNGYFLNCFAGSDISLDTHSELAPTITYFNQTYFNATTTSFNRSSLAAKVGWSAGATISGSPCPIEQEISAISPQLAVTMLGTNNTYAEGVVAFDRDLLKGVDLMLSKGVVPLLSTIPPRGDKADANALVAEMNAIIRAIAQMRQIPLMDYWQTLINIPGYGLAGDGVHPQVYMSGGLARGCWLTPDALQKGTNARNLITLEALDRARQYLLSDTPAPAEPNTAELVGQGTWADPFIIDSLPFVDSGDTRLDTFGSDSIDTYSCGSRSETGREIVYKLVLSSPSTISARVFDADSAGQDFDLDIYLLSQPDASGCLQRDDTHLSSALQPGTYYVVVDTYNNAGSEKAGQYRLTVVATQ